MVNDTSIFRLELPGRPGQTVNHKVSQPESKCPELLANYCDMLLRKTPLSKKLTSDEVEAKLRDVLLVLKYVQNKDVFMIYTKAHLTRRLILGKLTQILILMRSTRSVRSTKLIKLTTLMKLTKSTKSINR